VLRAGATRLTPGPKSPPASWKRGLIISHTRIGDILFRTCSLEQLKRGLPDCEWHYLAASDSAQVLQGNPFLNSVLALCASTASLHLLPGAVHQLRSMKFDVALCTNPEAYWQDHKIALAAKIPNRVGFTHRGLSGLVTHGVPCHHPSPWAGYFRQMVANLTDAVPDWPLIPKIYASEEDERHAKDQWQKMGLPTNTPVVACFMTTLEKSLVWPEVYYCEALKLIHRTSGAQVVLAGSKHDAPVLQRFAARCGIPSKVMAGELGLRGLFCFLKKCKAVLAPDSGPRHIANAAGTPVVFVRNLFNSKVETGSYCDNETDLSPNAEFAPLAEQEALLKLVSPSLAAQTVLQLFDRK